MPPLGVVLDRLLEYLQNGLLWEHGIVTLTRGFLGFAIALVVGVTLGILMARQPIVERTLEPLLAATFPIPRIALYPILILMFGFGAWSKIALVALECVYPITYNTYGGAQNVDRDLIWTARNAGVSRFTLVKSVILPAALPSIMAGVRTAVPIMLVVIILTELLGESQGLGFLVRSAGANFESDGALAVLLFLGLLGFVFDRLVVFLTRVMVFWERGIQT